MNNRFGDSSFAELLHTPFSQLRNCPPAESSGESFAVYDMRSNMRHVETLTLDSRIDDESRVMFKTFDASLQRIFLPAMDRPDGINHSRLQLAKSGYDYSQLVSMLSKIMELELNNSVVQKIRELKGIEMPAYYKRVKRDGNNRVIEFSCDNGKINLNRLKGEKSGDDELMPQTLGCIGRLIGKYSGSLSKNYERRYKKTKDFSYFGKLIQELTNKYRNPASHTSVLDEDKFIEFYEFFCSLIRDNWLTVIMDIKDSVSR